MRLGFASSLVLALAAGCAAEPARSDERLRNGELSRNDELPLLLERIFAKKEFRPKSFGPVRWIDGGKAFTVVEDSDLVRYDCSSGNREIVVSAASLIPADAGPGAEPLAIDDHLWSKDGRRVLLFTNTKKVWRQNTRGDYWVLDLEEQELRKLGGGFPEASLMFAKLAPDGERAAYVHANDLWVEDVEDGEITRLTSDGSDTIINGTSDWVYEEELDLRDGFRWSPDGEHIAFWRFDSSGVGVFSLIDDTAQLYPVVTTFRYPKAGTPNSDVRIGVVSAAGGEPRWIELPGDPREHYLPRMEWVEATGEIALQRMNRLQNRNEVWLADPATGAARPVLWDVDLAWLDVVDDWRWLAGGAELLWVSDRDEWRHAWAAAIDAGDGANGPAMRLVTPGNFDLLDVEGVDEERGLLYFASSPDDATRRYLYRASLDGNGGVQRVTPAYQPGTHSYDVSPDGAFAIHTYSSIDRPPAIDLVRLPEHEVVCALETNEALATAIAPLVADPAEFFQLEIADGVELDGWMIHPAGFDPSQKYPLLMYGYGEPSGVQATDAWKGNRQLFHRALTGAGYVVACVDNRGTPAPRGRAWRKMAHGSPGVLASADQAAAVRALLASRPYLDPERVAVWGWSGGGTLTLNLMFRSPEIYRVGMAVAPVADLALYDSIYQERYTGLPQENEAGYRAGSPIHFAEGLAGSLLLVHGTGDDNVHFQGTERLIDRLVALGKPFDLMVYPNRTHAISEGEGTALHVFSLLARYLTEHLPAGPR